MKKYAFNEITTMQYITLLSGLQVSVGFLALPRAMAEHAGTDGWISILIGWAVSVTAGLVLVHAMKRYPEGTLPDLLTHYIGKWVGKVSAALLALYYFYIAYVCLVYTVRITKSWLLPQTPSYMIMLLLLVPAGVIARNGLRILGRYAEIVVYLSLWIPFAYLIPLHNAHWLYLLPLLKEGWLPVLSTVPETFYFYAGYAVTFIVYPFLRNKRKASAGIVISNTLTMLLYMFISIACFIYFSPDRITEYDQPAIYMLKSIEFRFIERIEVLFIAFYMFIFSLAWIPCLFVGVFCTSWLLGKEDHRGHLWLLMLLLAASVFFYMPTSDESEKLNDLLGKMALGLEYVFPILLIIYIWLHDRFRRRKNA